jgi:predicted DNA-binding protein (MmcQ/YjbR family)
MDEKQLRAFTAGWPGVTAEIKWVDDLIFMVGGKMFCGLAVTGSQRGKLAFKVDEHRFLELTDRPGIVPAPYMARAHWISLDDPAALPLAERKALIRRAWELVAGKLTRKARRELGIED